MSVHEAKTLIIEIDENAFTSTTQPLQARRIILRVQIVSSK